MAITKYKTKQGQKYQAELYQEGKRVACKRGFETKKDAKRWLADQERTLLEQGSLQKTGISFLELANKYLDDVAARRQQNTYRYKRSVFQRFLAHAGSDFSAKEVSTQNLDTFFHSRSNTTGPKAANRDLRELKALYNWGVRKDLVQSNPFRTFEPFGEERFVRNVPTVEQIAAIRLAAYPEERDFLDVLYYTAARLSEVCRLTWQDVNFERKTVTLWTRKRKHGSLEPRTLAMVPSLYNTLWHRWNARDKDSPIVFTNPDGGQLHRNSHFVKYLFDRVCERAGVEKFTAHGIRHHIATILMDSKKATQHQIKNFLGHKRLTTTETYLHELDVDRDVASILEADEGDNCAVKFAVIDTRGGTK